MKINELESALQPGQKKEFNPSNTDPERGFDKFLVDCSESIAAMKKAKTFLYRGIGRNDAPVIFKGRSRDDRQPLDSNRSITKYIDEIMRHQGLTAVRSNSIFCSGNEGQTEEYGNTYLIFPINGFSFSWSPKVRDLTRYILNNNVYSTTSLWRVGKNYAEINSKQNAVQDIIDDFRIDFIHLDKNMDLWKLIHEYKHAEVQDTIDPKEHRIAILYYTVYDMLSNASSTNSGKFALFNDDSFLEYFNELRKSGIANMDKIPDAPIKKFLNAVAAKRSSMLSLFTNDMDDIAAGLEYTDKNFSKALSFGYEIMVHGEYYAFDASNYEIRMRKALLK
jgi:hypothetical protein